MWQRIKHWLNHKPPEVQEDDTTCVQSVLGSIEFIKNVDSPEWPEWKKEIWLNCLYAALPRAAESDRLFDERYL